MGTMRVHQANQIDHAAGLASGGLIAAWLKYGHALDFVIQILTICVLTATLIWYMIRIGGWIRSKFRQKE